jgi:hypothetical protein
MNNDNFGMIGEMREIEDIIKTITIPTRSKIVANFFEILIDPSKK